MTRQILGIHKVNTRNLLSIILACLSLSVPQTRGNEAVGGTASKPAVLSPDVVPTVFGRLGMITSVTLLSEKPVLSVLKGGPEINVHLDGKVIHIQPVVPEALSSVTFTVDGTTFVIKVRVSEEDPLVPNPVFTFAKRSRFEELDKAIASAARLKPMDVDLNGAIRTIERAADDQEFARTLRSYGAIPLGKVYRWNGCDIHLAQAHQFAEQDLILFKVVWVNTTDKAVYLHQDQYRLFVGSKRIPIIQKRQLAPRAIVFPGQQEVVWLAVQGYKLRLDNDWDLRLPADAAQLQAFTPVTR